MTDEKTLRRFVIRKFIATLVTVGITEYLLLGFINNILLPVATNTFFPELEHMKILSTGNLLLVVVLLLFYCLSVLLSSLFSFGSGYMMNEISQLLNYLGIGESRGDLVGLSPKSSVLLLLTLLAIAALIILPFAIGAVRFSRQVAREFKKLEEKNNNERLENERKRYLMISDIAHDLKTPMTTVSGYAKALSDGIVSEGDRQEYLDAISSKTERMNDIVQMLFDYVRLDSEGFDLVKKDTDICELVRECISSMYQDIEEKGDELEVDIPESKIMLSIDRIQFARVINNLLTNAVKHNDSNTSISVVIRQEIDEVRIYISDSGNVIDKELADNIFDPFVMGDKSRGSGGGSGLGLSVVKKIVDMHGFKIKLVQTPEIARYRLGDMYKKTFVIIIKT